MSSDPDFEVNKSGTFKTLNAAEREARDYKAKLEELLDALSNVIDVADGAFELLNPGDDGFPTAVPYRTPACDDHLDDNESDECPWCRLEAQEQLLHELRDWFAAYPVDIFTPLQGDPLKKTGDYDTEEKRNLITRASASMARHMIERIPEKILLGLARRE